MTVEIINQQLQQSDPPMTVEEIKKYYREDKIIWSVFLAFRRVDRLLKTRLMGRRYEFILPGKIKR